MASIFGTGNEINDYASLNIVNLINDVLMGMSYDEKQANPDMVAELQAERDEVENWHSAFLECCAYGEDEHSAACILYYMA